MINKFITFLLLFFIFFINILSTQEISEPIKFKADQIEYIYKKGKEKVTCRGSARIERSDFFLKAYLIRIYGINRNFSKADKHVKMINKKDNVVIYGDYAEYDNVKGYAKVFKSPRLIFTNENLEIISAVMETFLNEHKSIALGDVKITQTNYTAYSEKAVYWHEKEIIELTGDPIVYYGSDVFQAEKIIVYIKKEIVKLYDNVKAKVISKNENNKVKKEEEIE